MTDGCRLLLSLALEPDHWRRHDRGFWVQSLAGAIHDAEPGLIRVDTYEVRDMMVVVRVTANRSTKVIRKLLRDDESFLRLRARLADLGARAHIEIEGEG